MAHCHIQIRCGLASKDMCVGREYNFSTQNPDSKISPKELLEFAEKAIEKAIAKKFGPITPLPPATLENDPTLTNVSTDTPLDYPDPYRKPRRRKDGPLFGSSK